MQINSLTGMNSTTTSKGVRGERPATINITDGFKKSSSVGNSSPDMRLALQKFGGNKVSTGDTWGGPPIATGTPTKSADPFGGPPVPQGIPMKSADPFGGPPTNVSSCPLHTSGHRFQAGDPLGGPPTTAGTPTRSLDPFGGPKVPVGIPVRTADPFGGPPI